MVPGVTPFPSTSPPPPSSGFLQPPLFPITVFNFGQARAELASVHPDFHLDDVETEQLRGFLGARMTPEPLPRWLEWLEPGFFIAAILSAPLIACVLRPSIAQSPHYLFYTPVALVFAFVAVFFFRIVVVLPALLKSNSNAALIVWASLLELFLFWSANSLSRAPRFPAWAAWTVLSGIVSAILFPFALLVPGLLLQPFMERRKPGAHTRNPEAFIACQLFDVFSQSALTTVSPVPLAARRSWVQALSSVATCLDTSLVRQLTSSDIVLDNQIGAALRKRAAALRELAGQIALGGDSGPEIAARIRGLLHSACYLDWQSMPGSEAPAQTDRDRLSAWLHTAGRNLAIMVLPLGTLLALNRGWLVLDPDQRPWANVILLAWIALILLSLLDPNFEFTNKTLDTVGKLPVLGKFAKRD